MNASMSPEGRPFAAVLNSILENLQDIVRSEIRLVKAATVEELTERTHGAAWLAAGIVSAFFALSFLLVAAFLALLRLLPDWGAALAMAAGLTVIGAVAFGVYRGKSKERLS